MSQRSNGFFDPVATLPCKCLQRAHVQEIIGHERMETTQIYTHVNIKAPTEVHARSHLHRRLPKADEKPSASLQGVDPI
jgi:hypothetical protein